MFGISLFYSTNKYCYAIENLAIEPYWGITSYIGVGTPGIEGHVTWGGTLTISPTRFKMFGN